jgi:hypothetical protein
VSQYEDARDDVSESDEETTSYGTPKAGQESQDYSVKTLSPLSDPPTNSSTPAVKGKSPSRVSFSFSEVSSLGQKLFELLIRSGYLNGKFTCSKKITCPSYKQFIRAI